MVMLMHSGVCQINLNYISKGIDDRSPQVAIENPPVAIERV
jgi:hypothetical protein